MPDSLYVPLATFDSYIYQMEEMNLSNTLNKYFTTFTTFGQLITVRTLGFFDVSEFQSHQIHQKIEDISVELPNILYKLIQDFTLFE